jgi:glycosyltransferase involved in cell wall biosynthesis
MKLIIQIPCLNEEAVLPQTLAALPREVPGFDEVEWLVIDDGSSDATAAVARQCGVDHIVRFTSHKGLAIAFQTGIDAALKLGADVIVNTDADNQYRGDQIPNLVQPILEHRADVVVGDRGIRKHTEFSVPKKFLQLWGSWVVRQASGTDVPDVSSGFRAYSREAALRLIVVSRFSYTLETLIQAGKSDLAVAHVPIATNPKTRESHLFRSTFEYIRRSVGTILRIYAMHEPLRVFLSLAGIVGLAGLLLFGRVLWFYFTQPGPTGHVQSLIVASVLLVFAVQLAVLGVLADLVRANRVIAERSLQRLRKIELQLGVSPDTVDDADVNARERAGARA